MDYYETPTLILKDGTVLEGSECGYADHNLWCYIKNLSLTETFAVFSDPSKTETIIFRYGNTEEKYVGFTNLDIVHKKEFTVDVRLTGGQKE
jgi:hypothetical protein